MRRPLLLAALLLAAPSAWASFGAGDRGTTAGEFLTLGVGARAVGMGQGYSAVADEASALYWNPAALTRVPKRSATLMHATYINSSYFDYGAAAANLGKWGALGVGFQYFSAGKITETDITGTDVGSFAPYDLALSAGYAYELKDVEFAPDFSGFAFGLSGKFISSRILSTARSAAFDLGILSPAYFDKRFRMALTVTNLGGKLKYEQVAEPLPSGFRVGTSLALTPGWLVSADGVFTRSDNAYAAAGTEYQLAASGPWKFAGRAGFDSQTVSAVTGLTGVSMGFGVGYSECSFDYAFVPFGGLGQAHRLSITYAF